ncbi:AMP-binding enzyme (aureobasidin A1 biosynthesis complex) [Apiospora kogelbergensis]|uniref:AMP-binding enzyme (Aureobasidin A1 biosynthesis complex) n=1 Tax=Apiospora kogelbergensis TaxID=1337665 RepID=A0AAW0RA07_9PEZI
MIAFIKDPDARTEVEIVGIPTDIKAKLTKLLPPYMVPAFFIYVQDLPLTATGKLNRKRLGEIGASITVQRIAEQRDESKSGPGRSPATDVERKLHDIWSRTLKLEPSQISLDDNFFQLGGDSIACMIVSAHAYKLGLELTVADMFRHPKLEDLAEHAAPMLSDKTLEVLPFSLMGAHFDATSHVKQLSSKHGWEERSVQDIYPCTSLQEGLFSQEGEYIMRFQWALPSTTSVSSLRAAWTTIYQAFPILGTRIVQLDGLELSQVVLDDLMDWVETSDQGILENGSPAMETGQRLTRWTVLHDATRSGRWFVWDIHHAIYDGWSLELILDAVEKAYQGREIERGPPFQSFVRYCKDQQSESAGSTYWRQHLDGYGGRAFPSPSQRPDESPARCIESRKLLRPTMGPENAAITSSTLISASWAILEGSMTSSDDVVFGATLFGRNAAVPGIDKMAGPTFATVPIRIRLPHEQPCDEFLASVHHETSDMIPFEQAGLQRIAKLSPACMRACAFQTLLVVQPNEEDRDTRVLGRRVEDHKQQLAPGTYGLVLEANIESAFIDVHARYDPTVIQPWLVRDLLRRLGFVMSQLSSAGRAPLSSIKTMTQDDEDRIWQWNKTVPPPVDRCVHELIEDRVRLNPNAEAVSAWDGNFTYAELERLANHLAACLVGTHGVKPGLLVPLLFEKSKWTPVSMLGVMKAGAAFILLDDSKPREQLLAIVSKAEATLLLCSSSNQAACKLLSERVVAIDEAFFSITPNPAKDSHKTPGTSRSSDMVYVLFTSGSTGTPKGTIITHGSAVSALTYQPDQFTLTETSRLYDFSSHSFDAAIFATLNMLVTGGTVCIPSDDDRRSDLAGSINTLHANTALLTPSVAMLLKPDQVPNLHTIIFVGEKLKTRDIQPWWGRVKLINSYGPSETTPASTIRSCDPRVHSPHEALLIGTGVGQVTWIVDPENTDQLVPPGCVGELLLEGPLVGRGYLGEPEKTKAVFIDSPAWLSQFEGTPREGRMYKTGDLVRYADEDGNLDYVGRADSQVKIRGQRVELGEVELKVQELIKEASQVVAELVASSSAEHSKPVLVAFLLLDGHTGEARVHSVDVETEDRLAQTLASHMIPTFFVSMGAFPATRVASGPASVTPVTRARPRSGEYKADLSPIQGLYFATQPNPNICFDQHHLLEVRRYVAPKDLANALEHLVQSHEVLRARFARSETGTWEQRITNNVADSFHLQVIDNSTSPDAELHDIARCQDSLDIEHGPLLAAALFADANNTKRRQRLFISIHHLVVDIVSWQVMFTQLEQLLDDGDCHLPVSTTFTDFTAALHTRRHDGLKPKRIENATSGVCGPDHAYWGMEESTNRLGDSIVDEFTLDQDLSSLLLGTSCNAPMDTYPQELMMAALSASFGRVFSDRALPTMVVESHGRDTASWNDQIDVSSTIGWFTTLSPLQLGINPESSLRDMMRETKDKMREIGQYSGLESISQFMDDNNMFPAELSFNYAGQTQHLERHGSLFGALTIPDGSNPASAVSLRRFALFEVDIRVDRGCLVTSMAHHKEMRYPEKISSWFSEFRATLEWMAKHIPGSNPDWTIVDFPLAFHSYDSLDRFRTQWLPEHNIEAGNIEAIFPCSAMQEGILIAQIKDPRSYQTWFELDLSVAHDACLSMPKLNAAWAAVLKRHEMLRTLIVHDLPGTERPMQIVLRHVELQIGKSDNPKDKWERSSLSPPPAFTKNYLQYRLTLCKSSPQSARVLFEMNHAISDGFSFQLLERDLAQAYDSGVDLEPAGRYADFVSYLEGQPLDAGINFWSQHLAGIEPCIFPRSLRDGDACASQQQSAIPCLDSAQLHSFCSEMDITPATVIQTAWAMVLGMYTGTDVPCFGNLTSGRDVPVPAVDDIFGPLVGIVPCRIQLQKSQSILDTLRGVQADHLDSVPHQHISLASIHRALGLDSNCALFNSIVSIQKMGTGSCQPRSLTVTSGDGFDPTEYDVVLHVGLSPTDTKVVLSFRPGCLSLGDAARLARCTSEAVQGIITSPSKSPFEIPLLGQQDLADIWAWTGSPHASVDRCVTDMIQAVVASSLTAPAVMSWDGCLTYAELDDLANSLSRKLAELGVGPDIIVPLCFEKSMWTSVALLAVIKAGGAFVLLDPSLPEARLRAIAHQVCTLDLVLSSTANLALGSRLAKSVLEVSDDSLRTTEVMKGVPTPVSAAHLRDPTHTLFAVFTSGSTGTPKAAIFSHSAFASSLTYQCGALGIRRGSRVFDFASYAFDIAVHNVLAAFTTGACLCVPSEEERKSNPGASMQAMGVTVADLTPSVARFISADDVPTLETLILAGEAVTVDDAARWWDKQSSPQERLWFIDQLHPGLNWYHMPSAMLLRGTVCLKSLGAAFSALEQRHESLRTTFSVEDDVSIQIVHPFEARELEVVELAVLENSERSDVILTEALQNHHTNPFDLASEPGWRVRVYQQGTKHVLSIVMHHIISDGWSADIIRRELAMFYSSARRGLDPLASPLLAPIPIQYKDYAAWQRQQVTGEEEQRQLDYWLGQLESSRPAELLADKPRPETLSGRAELQEWTINGPLYARLQDFCQRHDTTLHVVLLAAFQATLYRLTGLEDTVVGTANANRDRPELRDVVGFFVALQCIRSKIEARSSFEDLVKQVKKATIDGLAHQDLPFETIVSRLQSHRDMSRHPLVQIMFTVHSHLDAGTFRLDDVETEPLETAITSRFDLEVHLFREAKGLRGDIVYSTDLYQSSTIKNMLELYSGVLEVALSAAPKTPISELPLMTESAYSALDAMGLTNAQQPKYPSDSSVVDAFREQVISHPNRVAAKNSSSQLTYAELDRDSDSLARWLSRHSLSPGNLVVVIGDRSCQTIIAFLGILKANLAYLPFDTKAPAGRIEGILSTLPSPRFILLGRGIPSPQTTLPDVHSVAISQTVLDGRSDVDAVVATGPTATSLAYTMFTSGSTGQPKGVMVEHRSIVRLVKNSNVVAPLPNPVIMGHISNTAFDAATLEIYSALLNGGTVVCIDTVTAIDQDLLARTFDQEGIHATFMTTALMKESLKHEPCALRKLQVLYVGGERVDPQDARSARAIVRGTFINGYGPTENTTFSTIWEAPGDDRELYTNGVPIGRSVSNSTAHVMDSAQQLVPLGVVGELVVAGDGLARGYTDPEKDVNRFVHVSIGGRRVRAYRTGDVVRYRPTDGQLEFFGRIDGQVKLRGHRVELGEIEHALVGHDLVHNAAAVLQVRDGQASHIDSFVTLHEKGRPESSRQTRDSVVRELYDGLRKQLPSYMVPSSIHVLERMPVNANGKLDRRALVPDSTAVGVAERTEGSEPKQLPTSDTERQLAQIWSRLLVLQRESIGVDDDFFRLGGSSISAMKVVNQARKTGLSLSVADVFRQPRLRQLAALIEGRSVANDGSNGSITRRPQTKAIVHRTEQSSAQKGLWFIYQLDPASTKYLMPFSMHLRGPLQLPALQSALRTIELRHETLRTTFKTENGAHLQIVHAHQEREMRVIDASEGELMELLARDQSAPFVLESEPGWRVTVYRANDQHHVLSITMHHIVSDGWSVGLLQEELATFYTDEVHGRGPPSSQVPFLPIQYRDYSEWQQEQIKGGDIERQLRYWDTQLLDSRPAVFSSDRPRPKTLSGNASVQKVKIPAATYARLQSFSKTHGVTLFTILLAAFRAAHFRLTGATDSVIGTPNANRDRVEVEHLVGYFVNMHCIRIEVERQSLQELVEQVKLASTSAMAHKDAPFDQVVSRVLDARRRDPSRHPLAQVVFAYHVRQNQGQGENVDGFRILMWKGNELDGGVCYSTDLYDYASINCILSVFTTILDSGLRQPTTPISALPLSAEDSLSTLNVEGFFGHADGRVKIGGDIVSIPEIEKDLQSFDLVLDAAIVVQGADHRRDAAGLVAFVVAKEAASHTQPID